ncbi:hypothetical protein EK904_011073, partial [Melospiza melodia maxima]
MWQIKLRIKVSVQLKTWIRQDRDDRCFGRDRDRFRDSERFESDWRARPAAPDAFDDYPPRRGDDGFGDSYDSRIGSGRRAFGSGYRRDDDYRGYEDRYDRRDDRMDRWNSRDDYGRDDFRREDR